MSWLVRRSLSAPFRLSQTRLSSPFASSAFAASRNLHSAREYPHVEEGLGDFLPPEAVRMIAVDYQNGLLQRLNDLVKDTEMEYQSVAQTVISTASDRSQALAFNYASQALNNSFFLENLKPPPAGSKEGHHGHPIPIDLEARIRRDFGSVEMLQSTFSAAAMGMMGSGWVWLVRDQMSQLGVVATYGPGTMLVRSRMQRFNDMGPVIGEPEGLAPGAGTGRFTTASPAPPPVSSPTSGTSHPPQSLPHTPSTKRSFFGASTSERQKLPGEVLSPLFCVSVHEHAWLGTYGIWGKEEYLKRFWTVLDWEKVGNLLSRWSVA